MAKKTKKKIKSVPSLVPTALSATDSVIITLKCLGRVFKAEGATLEDALKKIKISGGTRALSVLTVIQGERKRVKILPANITNQLFGYVSNTAKIIGLKYIKQIFP